MVASRGVTACSGLAAAEGMGSSPWWEWKKKKKKKRKVKGTHYWLWSLLRVVVVMVVVAMIRIGCKRRWFCWRMAVQPLLLFFGYCCCWPFGCLVLAICHLAGCPCWCFGGFCFHCFLRGHKMPCDLLSENKKNLFLFSNLWEFKTTQQQWLRFM